MWDLESAILRLLITKINNFFILESLLFLINIWIITAGIKQNFIIPLCWRYFILYVEKIEIVLNKEFPSLFEWIIDNKLSVHFWDDEIKTIIFSRNTVEYLGLNYSSRRLLCDALMQPHFDYGCTSWHFLQTKVLKISFKLHKTV